MWYINPWITYWRSISRQENQLSGVDYSSQIWRTKSHHTVVQHGCAAMLVTTWWVQQVRQISHNGSTPGIATIIPHLSGALGTPRPATCVVWKIDHDRPFSHSDTRCLAHVVHPDQRWLMIIIKHRTHFINRGWSSTKTCNHKYHCLLIFIKH